MLALFIVANLALLAFAAGMIALMLGRRPWWSYRFRLAVRDAAECWWLAASGTRRLRYSIRRAECSALTFRLIQLPDVAAWLAYYCGPAVLLNLKIKIV